MANRFANMEIENILHHDTFTREELVYMLTCSGLEEEKLFSYSGSIRNKTIGNHVHMRGLIEFSNICIKDCLYCGIRKSNKAAQRYSLTDEDILSAAEFAYKYKYGSVVLQGGERKDKEFIQRIDRLVREIKRLSNNSLGITLSVGEQTEDTYLQWKEAGAHRYLQRIESSNQSLYTKIHPQNDLHDFKTRLECIKSLQRCGYQTGTGVMIGLPWQTIEDLADDLLFLKDINIDMVGMGPYLEHHETPLWEYRNLLQSQNDRLKLGLHMVSCLRIMMPDINIAATTALQAIHPAGREKALEIGANVIMPNVTPLCNRANYQLYENKPGMDEGAEESTRRLVESVHKSGCEIEFTAWGDSEHFFKRME